MRRMDILRGAPAWNLLSETMQLLMFLKCGCNHPPILCSGSEKVISHTAENNFKILQLLQKDYWSI